MKTDLLVIGAAYFLVGDELIVSLSCFQVGSPSTFPGGSQPVAFSRRAIA